jgi:hypothetical protein
MKMRDWITLFASVVLIATAFILGLRCGAGKVPDRLVDVDTLRIKEIVRDTVLRWYERVIWKDVPAETVVIYKDTLKPETLWGRWPESIINLDYARGKLSFTSLLPVLVATDSLGQGRWTGSATVREYSYGVGERFSVSTKGEGFFVKSLRDVPRFAVSLGTEAHLWGDSTASRIVPYAEACLTWRGASLGPRLDTRGLHLNLRYEWRF